MIRSRDRIRAGLVLAALLATGCGYGLVGRTSNLPPDIDSIYVRPLENRTTRQQVDLLLTDAIVQELVTRRRFDVVRSEAEADAILRGSLLAYLARPVRFNTEGRATDYEIVIRADMEFARRDGTEVLWKQSNYQFREDFELEVGDTTYFDPEDQTIGEVARSFAQTLVIDLLEGF